MAGRPSGIMIEWRPADRGTPQQPIMSTESTRLKGENGGKSIDSDNQSFNPEPERWARAYQLLGGDLLLYGGPDGQYISSDLTMEVRQ